MNARRYLYALGVVAFLLAWHLSIGQAVLDLRDNVKLDAAPAGEALR